MEWIFKLEKSPHILNKINIYPSINRYTHTHIYIFKSNIYKKKQIFSVKFVKVGRSFIDIRVCFKLKKVKSLILALVLKENHIDIYI